MNIKSTNLILAALVFTTGHLMAQSGEETERISELMALRASEDLVLDGVVQPEQIGGTPIGMNTIFIEQVGTNNLFNVKINSITSDLNAIQQGDNNRVKLDLRVLNVSNSFRQQGNNHYIAEFAFNPGQQMQHQIYQTGSGQNLTLHGSNSLSEKMKVTMNGSSNTVIIRSFN